MPSGNSLRQMVLRNTVPHITLAEQAPAAVKVLSLACLVLLEDRRNAAVHRSLSAVLIWVLAGIRLRQGTVLL